MEAIEYNISIADVETFSLYSLMRSPLAKRNLRAGQISFAFMMLVMFSFMTVPTLGAEGLVVPMLLAVAAAVLHPVFYAYSIRAMVRRNYSVGKNRTVLGRHRLKLLESELREESEASSHSIRYDAIERVDESDSHVFIYVTVVSAHVLPKNAVSSGEVASFVASLRERMEQTSETSAPGFAA